MNPLAHLAPYVRAFIYLFSAATAALLAAFAAIGEIPNWLIFASAFITTLGGGTAVSNLDFDDAQ